MNVTSDFARRALAVFGAVSITLSLLVASFVASPPAQAVASMLA